MKILKLAEEISEDEFLAYIAEWEKPGERIVPAATDPKGESYEVWLARNIKYRTTVPNGFVTATTYFLVDTEDKSIDENNNRNKILGAVDIRHSLNDYLMKAGGHIGYGVRSSCRGNGYAKVALSLALEKCRELKIERVLVTCDDTNIASAKTIEACSGVLENIIDDNGTNVRRYWIEV